MILTSTCGRYLRRASSSVSQYMVGAMAMSTRKIRYLFLAWMRTYITSMNCTFTYPLRVSESSIVEEDRGSLSSRL